MGTSVPEIRRLLHLVGSESSQLAFHLHWSLWRREHQWQAQQAHTRRRARQLARTPVPDVSINLPDPLAIAGLPALTPAHWERIAPLLPAERTAGRPYRQHRQILDGMLSRHDRRDLLASDASGVRSLANDLLSISTLET
jgi:DNA-binding transcriptional MerR regulator